MANLAIAGSGRVNGVSELHTKLLCEQVFSEFYELDPSRFVNETNGITPRRWLSLANPELAALISSRIGNAWETDLEQLERLTPLASEPDFQRAWREVKSLNKARLAVYLRRHHGVEMNPSHLVDTQVKRIHEYKRQLLNVLHVVWLYLERRREPNTQALPRTFLFGGKAAPGYDMAKRIVHLINAVATTIDADPLVSERLRVVFVPNYGVSVAELVIPASDVSEQISTAGTEASGTGNMKFALNGALTIGTLDGANIEIRDAIGEDNFFLFGMNAEQVEELKRTGYDPQQIYRDEPRVHAALSAIAVGMFSPENPECFRPIVDSLLHHDPYLVLADFASYADCQLRLEAAYHDAERWTRASILNVARIGRFSSDRTIRGYARDVWGIEVP